MEPPVRFCHYVGLTAEGIYRISGVKSKVQALKDAYNQHVPVYLPEYEPNVVASLLKQYLRDLPEPVLTDELMPKFEQASSESVVFVISYNIKGVTWADTSSTSYN